MPIKRKHSLCGSWCVWVSHRQEFALERGTVKTNWQIDRSPLFSLRGSFFIFCRLHVTEVLTDDLVLNAPAQTVFTLLA